MAVVFCSSQLKTLSERKEQKMKTNNIEDAYNTAIKLKLTKDDLLQEASLVEDEGSYYHMSLLGYSPSELREIAKLL